MQNFGMEFESITVPSEHTKTNKRSRSHSHRSAHRSHSHKNRSLRGNRREEDEMPPTFQTAVTLEDTHDGQEVIEVQILPQDENWGENTTAVTGNTSDQSGSVEEVNLWPGEPDPIFQFPCSRYVTVILGSLICFIALFSPITMLVLPKLGFFPPLGASLSATDQAQLLSCGAECKGLAVSLCFKSVLLLTGLWAIFIRRSRSTLPGIFICKTLVLLFTLVCTFTYWLFYVLQITEGAKESATGEETLEYKSLVAYASSLTDTLLFIHYIAVVLIEIRHLQPVYYLKVIRSPDGESKSYAIGQMSIQRAAVWILDKYYTEFPIYNPYLERIPVSKSRKPTSSFKFYEVDGINNSTLPHNQNNRTTLSTHSRRRDSSHNERFYEEHDYERRVKKRRARLITAAEDAFTHIKRISCENGGGGAVPMDSQEAAQAVFPSLARSLQKYLRVTRQQPRHSVDAILNHLSRCIAYDLAPRAFLEKFLQSSPVLQSEKEVKEAQCWSLVCDDQPSGPLKSGTVFQLKQNDVSLLCYLTNLPHYSINEDASAAQMNKFTLRLNSETSV